MKKLIFIAVLLVSVIITKAGNEFSGKVLSADNQELVGAKIEVVGTDYVFYTDFDGNFDLSELPEGTYTLKISYISYKDKVIENFVWDKRKMQMNLKPIVLN
jgi:iron complex outermembrane receptor protein